MDADCWSITNSDNMVVGCINIVCVFVFFLSLLLLCECVCMWVSGIIAKRIMHEPNFHMLKIHGRSEFEWYFILRSVDFYHSWKIIDWFLLKLKSHMNSPWYWVCDIHMEITLLPENEKKCFQNEKWMQVSKLYPRLLGYTMVVPNYSLFKRDKYQNGTIWIINAEPHRH